jgi:hypothetical protein
MSYFMISFLLPVTNIISSTHTSNAQGSWGSVVTYMVIKLQAGQLMNYHLIPSTGKILHSPTHPYQLCKPPSSTEWVPRALPVGIKWPWHKAVHSPPSSTKIKNEWYRTATHLHVFMASIGTMLFIRTALYMGSSVQNLTATHPTRDFRLPPWSRCEMHSSGLLHSE